MAAGDKGSKADSEPSAPTTQRGAKLNPTTNPPLEQPVFEAGAGRGGVADHSIVSPTVDPAKKPEGKAS